MIVLITGGREYNNLTELYSVLDKLHSERSFKYLVHGNARGADKMAHRWATDRGVQPVSMEALWDYEGKTAGTKRNARMLLFAKPDLCVAFSGGRGTAHMMRLAYNNGVELIDVEDFCSRS